MINKKTLRLGYLVPEFPGQTHAFFWREVEALREQGVNVQLLSTRRPPPGACRHAFADGAAEETQYLFPPNWLRSIAHLLLNPSLAVRAIRYVLGLDELTLSRRLVQLSLLLPAAQLALCIRRHGTEHLHVHSCANAAHVAALGKLLGGCTYSLTLHGDLGVYGTDHKRKAEHASFIACVTRPLQEEVRRVTGVSTERSPLLWMGVDTSRFRPTGVRESRLGELKLLTVARLNPTKGHRFALRALRKAIDKGLDAEYFIAGEGPERLGIEQEIERLGLQTQVRLLGTKSEDEILLLLQSCDALVLSSVGAGEAAPVSVMEAMSCGLPVVCSRIGGTADMISDGVDGYLVEQQDVDAITDRLLMIGHNLELRWGMGLAARSRAVDEFDSHALASRLVQLVISSQLACRCS